MANEDLVSICMKAENQMLNNDFLDLVDSVQKIAYLSNEKYFSGEIKIKQLTGENHLNKAFFNSQAWYVYSDENEKKVSVEIFGNFGKYIYDFKSIILPKQVKAPIIFEETYHSLQHALIGFEKVLLFDPRINEWEHEVDEVLKKLFPNYIIPSKYDLTI